MSISFQDQNLSMEDFLSQETLQVSSFQKGERIKGKVASYRSDDTSKNIILSLSSKFEGSINASEFEELPPIGSDIEGVVKGFNQEKGLFIISHRDLSIAIGTSYIQEAFNDGFPIECKIKRKVAKGFIVDVQSVEMFLPFSQAGLSLSDEGSDKKQGFVGSIVQCKVLQLPNKRQLGVVSRKVIQDQKTKESWKVLSETIKVGDIVEGKVLKVAGIGFYIAVQDVVGFLHNSNVRWSRVKV